MESIPDYQIWLTLGALLMVLEILTPGVFFMWIGFGAFITGALSFLLPDAGFVWLGPVFAALSVVSVLIGRKLIKPEQKVKTDLNNRGSRYIGKHYQVAEPFENGRGKIKVDDTLWMAESKEASIPYDATVKVVGTDGTFLKVECVNENSK